MKFKVAILTLCLLVIATHPACSIDEGAENLIDARYVYAVPYQRLLELGTDGLGMPLPEIVIAGLKIHLIILFPELYATNMNITYGIKRDSLPDACQHDLNIIELAEKYGLDYDRKWLLYWWPEKGSILSPKEYMTLVFYTTFMPPKYRDIFFEQEYQIGGFVPTYFHEILSFWIYQFELYTSGYVFDIFTGQSLYDPEAAEKALIRLRDEIADYYDLECIY